MNRTQRVLAGFLILVLMMTVGNAFAAANVIQVDAIKLEITESGNYTSLEEVAAYLTTFGHLPDNYLTKKQAQALGWDSRAGNLNQAAPGKSIGGDYFGNYEGLVPSAKGRQWTECDIDSDGGYRNGLRLVFSNDGLLYYSDDHYQSFRQVTVSGEPTAPQATAAAPAAVATGAVEESGWYTSKEDVSLYLRTYAHLPSNYLTRDEAKALGWSSKKDNLADVAPGYAIGGDAFGNREGLLPDRKGRQWFECDVNGVNGKRSSQRLVWSNDGLLYYTPDNHKSFEQLD